MILEMDCVRVGGGKMGFVLVMVFFTAMFFTLALVRLLDRKSEVKDRLERYIAGNAENEKKEKSTPALKAGFERMASVFASRSYTEKIQVELLQAGLPLKGEEFITLWVLLATAIPAVTWLVTRNWPLAILVLLLAVFGPRFYLQHKKGERLKTFNQQLGDALVIMANALRAGFGFQQAMETVRRELPPPISTEFEWTLREIQLGSTTEESLLNLCERVKSDDLDMVVTAVLIQRQVGGNLAQILDNISRTIRDRTRIKGEIRTLTAQGRLSGIIIGLLPIALLFILLILNPGYMTPFLQNPLGAYMLGAAALSEVIGLFVIKKIVDIDV